MGAVQPSGATRFAPRSSRANLGRRHPPHRDRPGRGRRAARTLRARGVEAVAIVFINAYANPANERAALAAVKAVWPNEYIVTSHEILPEIREFERTSTTTLNAYLQPTIASYLRRLEDSLRAESCDGDVLIVQSNGGVMTLETACQRPIRTALSGPRYRQRPYR